MILSKFQIYPIDLQSEKNRQTDKVGYRFVWSFGDIENVGIDSIYHLQNLEVDFFPISNNKLNV